MRRFAALFLCAAGCSGFHAPTPSEFETLGLPERPSPPGIDRLKIRLSVDGDTLAGEFDGVVLVRRGENGPTVRLQLFGDLGPKTIELMSRRDRIVGYFPQTREAVDCALPGEASPHPLLFMGATLVERFTDVTKPRVIGVRQEEGGAWGLDLRPAIDGMSVRIRRSKDGRVTMRRFSWMYGLSWTEEWTEDAARAVIEASGLSIRLQVLEEYRGIALTNPGVMDLSLPDDARIVRGSRK